MGMSKKIELLAREVRLTGVNDQDYVCLTDIARYKNSERTDYLISNWLRNRNTIEFIGIGEQRNNPVFNPVKSDGIRKQAGLNSGRRADMKPMTTLILSADGAAAYQPRNALRTACPILSRAESPSQLAHN